MTHLHLSDFDGQQIHYETLCKYSAEHVLKKKKKNSFTHALELKHRIMLLLVVDAENALSSHLKTTRVIISQNVPSVHCTTDLFLFLLCVITGIIKNTAH